MIPIERAQDKKKVLLGQGERIIWRNKELSQRKPQNKKRPSFLQKKGTRG